MSCVLIQLQNSQGKLQESVLGAVNLKKKKQNMVSKNLDSSLRSGKENRTVKISNTFSPLGNMLLNLGSDMNMEFRK